MNKTKKILMLGNLPGKNPRSVGGATKLFQDILEFLRQHSSFLIEQKPLRSLWLPKFQLLDYFLWPFKAPFIFRPFDVISIHATYDFTLTIAPLVIWWAKQMKKQVVYHTFGGMLHKKIAKLPGPARSFVLNGLRKADTLFVETLEMLEWFRNQGFDNVEWMPNSRPAYPGVIRNIPYQRKFVFISRVTPNKGVDILVKAFSKLGTSYTLDIYGPLDRKYYSEQSFDDIPNIRYLGSLDSNNVRETLLQYNFLILPSFHTGEGYPGIIIESFSVGVPVIATNWRSIPELVTHEKNGLLVEPKSVESLVNAILSIDDNKYNQLRDGAIKRFNDFDAQKNFNKFIKAYTHKK